MKGSVDKFLCAICIQLLFDPVQTSCGHLFCDKCLKKWKKNTCPTCQTAFTGPATIDNFNNREVKNLTILCPNVSRGCEWKGELGSVEAHQKDHCAYQLVQCPNKCGTAVERRELEKHKNDHCELREYECPYCENDPDNITFKICCNGTFKDITTEHLKECGGYPVDCPNNCGAQGLVRGDLPSHLAACPEQVVPCRYQTLGCKVRLARTELIDHLEDKDGHLVLAMETTSDLVHQLSRVEAEHRTSITTLQQQMSILLKKSGVQLPSAPQHPAKPWLKVDPLPLYPPFTVKMNFSRKKEDVSPPFMSHPGGYRLVLRAEYTFHECYLTVEPVDCPENHSQKWPVTITMKYVILNQEEDKYHRKGMTEMKLQHPNTKSMVGILDTKTASIKQDRKNFIYYIKLSEVGIHT